MTWWDVVVLFVAGTAAGTINTVVGSGSLITFPALLALGYPPIIANVTNNVGVFPGGVSGAWGYRRELRGQWRELLPLAAFSFAGGLLGAILLFVLPAAAFNAIVPVLIIIACVLVIMGPMLKRWTQARQADARATAGQRVALRTGAGLTGVYGGYFGAAQGVILLALLSILLPGDLNKANAYKNVLAALANGAAAVVFLFSGKIDWLAALIIALGAILGGQLGARIGRRLPAVIYRIVIVLIGIAAVVYFYVK